LDAVSQIELGEDPADVGRDGRVAGEHVGGDFGVVAATRDLGEQFELVEL
jgi:hypothetical protein